MSYDNAFAGMKVIDLTGGVAGPSCAMMLAQQYQTTEQSARHDAQNLARAFEDAVRPRR